MSWNLHSWARDKLLSVATMTAVLNGIATKYRYCMVYSKKGTSNNKQKREKLKL